MMRRAVFVAVSMLAAGAAAAQARPATPALICTAPTPQAGALGVEMATLMNSEALTLIQSRKLFNETMPRVMASNTDIAQLESEYPGLIAHVIKAMQPEIERQALTGLPVLWQRLGGCFAANLTEAELRTAVAFYKSPTGIWMIDQVGRNSDMTAPLTRMLKEDDSTIKATDIKDAVTDPGTKAIRAAMTPEHMRALTKFTMTPLGRKLHALNPRMAELATQWSNENQPENEAKINDIVIKATTEFVERASKSRNGTGVPTEPDASSTLSTKGNAA